jgi:hypothetical protein
MLPPPRQTISNSHSARSPARRMASAIWAAAPSPCTRRRDRRRSPPGRRVAERAQYVAQGSCLQRGDDADAARKGGQGALAGAGEQAFAFELFLEAKELLVEVADAGATSRFDVELEIAARFVERDQHARLDVLAVLESPAEQLRAVRNMTQRTCAALSLSEK